jgi:hypothetical protein
MPHGNEEIRYIIVHTFIHSIAITHTLKMSIETDHAHNILNEMLLKTKYA